MNPKISFLSVIIFLVFLSCQKDTFETPNHSGKLKRKLSFRSVQDTVPYSISEYQYDSKGRIQMIQDKLNTELFEYNKNNDLIRKFTYQTDIPGTTLSDTTYYKYQNGKLVFDESIQLPVSEYSSSIQSRYEYENSKLIRKKIYRDHHFERMTDYEYLGELCSKELYYNDSTGVRINSFRDFAYDNNKLSMSTLIGFAAGNRKYVLQVVYYIYDDSGNLVLEYAEQNMEISAWISYSSRYEYY